MVHCTFSRRDYTRSTARNFDLRVQVLIAPRLTQITQFLCDSLGVYSDFVLLAEDDHERYCSRAYQRPGVLAADIQNGVSFLPKVA